MGRTKRIRQRNRKPILNDTPENNSVLNDLQDWMTSMGWSPTCSLTPHIFDETGRGLKCLSAIPRGQIIIRIPRTLLVTTTSVFHSKVHKIFLKSLSYDAQTVLATLLVFEKHLGDNSAWNYYIESLPRDYTVPSFCKNREKSILPEFISRDLEKQSQKIIDGINILMYSINRLREKGNDVCEHCGVHLGKIISFREFKWGFYTVNTRAVYLDSSKNVNNFLNISGDDNMALAPFLDLFNHSYNAQVKVGLEVDGRGEFYEIRSLKPFNAGSQVFINYGGHCNAKLYLEYGFFMRENPLDEVYIEFAVIEGSLKVLQRAREFILGNGFHEGIGFNSEGLNYHAKIVFYVVGCRGDEERWKERVFRYDFEQEDLEKINKIGVVFVERKKKEFMMKLEACQKTQGKSESFKVFVGLLGEYVQMCNRCLQNLEIGKLIAK